MSHLAELKLELGWAWHKIKLKWTKIAMQLRKPLNHIVRTPK